MPNWLLNRYRRVRDRINQLDEVVKRVDELQKAVGRLELRLPFPEISSRPNLQRYEFKVFSQWGEDGIIQYLIQNVSIQRKIFVEFGVEAYKEANTRFLMENDNWHGVVMDASARNIRKIKSSEIYYRHDLQALCAFVTRDNINDLLRDSDVAGDIGLLSIDIDGNDYWVWKAITSIAPAIVIIEYNCRFGVERSVTIPYDPEFTKTKGHFSGVYFGASLRAIHALAIEKGYAFVGCNAAGVNAFFVRKDLLPPHIRELTVEEGFVMGRFRDSRNERGELNFLSREEELRILNSLPLVEITHGH